MSSVSGQDDSTHDHDVPPVLHLGGLVRDRACNQLFHFSGARILLLGAGGAARGVLRPLLAENPQLLVIANRTVAKALALAGAAASWGKVRGGGFDELAGGDAGRGDVRPFVPCRAAPT